MIKVICGTEPYLIQRKIDEIIHECSKEDIANYDASAKEFDIINVINECNMPNLFSSSKIVLVKDPYFLTSKSTLKEAEAKALITYAKDVNVGCELVFYGCLEIDKRKKINKDLQKLAQYIILDKLSNQEFINYVKTSIKKSKLDITSDALELLIDILPNDLGNFHQELDKLCLYNEKIDSKIIKKMVNIPLDDDVFNLTNAIIKKNVSKAFNKWNDLKQLKQEPIGIALIIANQFRFMYQIRYLMDKGWQEQEIAQYLKAHPYRVSLTCRNVQGVKRERLLEILAKLAALDQGFKSGKIDRNIGLDKFMIEIMR